jgi:hypothetical protein
MRTKTKRVLHSVALSALLAIGSALIRPAFAQETWTLPGTYNSAVGPAEVSGELDIAIAGGPLVGHATENWEIAFKARKEAQ